MKEYMLTKSKILLGFLQLSIIWIIINIRWAYFHVSPAYQKFYMTKEEPWFQHIKDGSIHCNYTIEENSDDNSL